jgi:cytidylate kinase
MAIVTISRGSYTKGKEIAERVAAKLGYECLSRDVLLEASAQFNIPEIRLVRALHDAPSVLERFGHGRERYVAFIENAFLEHVRRDNVVYHGLAGHFFLRGVAHGFKVRVIADLEERVRLEMERQQIDERTARETLKKDDFERRRWALALYGVDTVDPILYDMVLNVGNMTLDCAVEMISGAARSPCFSNTAESQAALDNLVLASRVRVAVVELCPEARASAVDGTVFVDVEAPPGEEMAVRRKVQSLAAAVDGVARVRVNVRPPGPP